MEEGRADRGPVPYVRRLGLGVEEAQGRATRSSLQHADRSVPVVPRIQEEDVMRPDDIVYQGGFDSCVYGHVDDGYEGSVRDASTVKRATAQRQFAHKRRRRVRRGLLSNDVRAIPDATERLGRVRQGPVGRREDRRARPDVSPRPRSRPRAQGVLVRGRERRRGAGVQDRATGRGPAGLGVQRGRLRLGDLKRDAPGATKIYVCELR